MSEDDLLDPLDEFMKELGNIRALGVEYRANPLDVLLFHARGVSWSKVPVLGRAASVLAVVRQPPDLDSGRDGLTALLDRVAGAANTRYPPWRVPRGLTIALTTLVLTPEPIKPADEVFLSSALSLPARSRCVPLGLFRVNLGQEAMAFSLARGPGGRFEDPRRLADFLCARLKRYVPLVEF